MTETRSASRSGFVGRARDLERLATATDDAAGGRGRVVLVTGEPGIGKTALVEEHARGAGQRGFRVLRGACWEGEGAPEYWPWVQVVRAYARESTPDDLLKAMGGGAATIARLVPDVARMFLTLPEDEDEPDPERARFRLFDHVSAFLRAIAGKQPLFVVLDDLHWADLSSLTLLRFVSRELRDAPILTVGTLRDDELGDAAASVVAELARDRIALAGLDAEQVAELISTTTGVDAPQGLVNAIHHRTTGNPFLVAETARLLEAQGRLESESIELAIPEGARDVLGRRLARLSQRCVSTLSAASVLGNAFGLEMLTPVAARSHDELLADLDEADGAKLVRAIPDAAGRYEFAHALIREVLYDGIAANERATLHVRAGEALESSQATNLDPYLAEIAHHYGRALPAGSAAKAAEFARRAGIRALRLYAYDEAAAHFRRAAGAFALVPDGAAPRVGALLNQADALTRAGGRPEARHTYLEAATFARGIGDAESLAHAALGLGGGISGFEVTLFDEEQLRLLHEALALLPEEDSSLRAWLLARLSVAQSYAETPFTRAAVARRAVDMARRVGDSSALAYALSSLCDSIPDPDHVDERADAANEMVEVAARIGGMACGVPSCEVCLCDPELSMLARRFLVVAYLEKGDVAAADSEVEAYARLADHVRQPLYRWLVPLWRAMRAQMRGDGDAFQRHHAEAAAIGEQAHSGNAAVLVLSQRMDEARLRDDPSRAAVIADEILARFPDQAIGDHVRMTTVWLQAAAGDHDAARAGLAAVLARIHDVPRDAEWLPQLCLLAEAIGVLGDTAAAARVFPMLEPYAHLVAVDGIGAGVFGSVAHFLGVLARTLGRDDDAARYFEEALRAHAEWQAEPLLALTRRERTRLDAEQRSRGTHAMFRHDGDVWTLGWDGDDVHVKNAKGLRDIATLIGHAGREVHALDLYAPGTGGAQTAAAAAAPGGLDAVERGAGEALDPRARDAYKARLVELQEEIDDATALGDAERAARAREEMDLLASELAGAFGLGGRARPQADPAERARKAVTERIRDSLARIEAALPPLGAHLRRAIRTGSFCAYLPDERVDWSL